MSNFHTSYFLLLARATLRRKPDGGGTKECTTRWLRGYLATHPVHTASGGAHVRTYNCSRAALHPNLTLKEGAVWIQKGPYYALPRPYYASSQC